MSTPVPTDEFWWLPDAVAVENLFVYVAHDPPVKDEVEPYEKTWYHSLDGGEASTASVLYPALFVQEWRRRWTDCNVHKSLIVYTSGGEPVSEGPFLVDIDNEAEDLADTLHVVRRVEQYLSSVRNVSEDGMRVFFSGRKGFHVEVRPSGVAWSDADSIRVDLIAFLMQQSHGASFESRNQVSNGGTVIDKIHDYVRLPGSINAWLADDGTTIERRKIRIGPRELHDSTIDDLVKRSEMKAAVAGSDSQEC